MLSDSRVVDEQNTWLFPFHPFIPEGSNLWSQLTVSDPHGWLQKIQENSQEIFPGNKPHPAIQRCTDPSNNRVPKKYKLLPAPLEQAVKLLYLFSNYWKQWNYCICFQIKHIIYMYKLCLALNDPQRLICHKTKTPPPQLTNFQKSPACIIY